jgi:hypothetical protein
MKPAAPVAAVLATLAFALCVMCGTDHATLDDETSPCTVLAAECPHCTQPAAKQECQTAVASADDVQCIAVLDDSAVVAACGSDGGADAADDTPMPACDAAQASPEAGCTCASPCAASCPEGQCDITCTPGGDAGATCSPSCEGGHCTVHCSAGTTCEGSCAGGGCLFVCTAGSTCENSCTGGGCTFQCLDNAVCNDSCAVDAGCSGY